MFELLDGDESDLRETIAALSRYIERLAPEALSDHQVRDLVNSARLQRGTAFLLLKDDTAAQTDFQPGAAREQHAETVASSTFAQRLPGTILDERAETSVLVACDPEDVPAALQILSPPARRKRRSAPLLNAADFVQPELFPHFF